MMNYSFVNGRIHLVICLWFSSRLQSGFLGQAYTILGVDPEISDADLNKAYKVRWEKSWVPYDKPRG